MMITENRDKEKGVVNGTKGTVHSVHNTTIFLETDDLLIPIFPVTNSKNITYYPMDPAYSTTITKAQGQTIKHATVFFDSQTLPPGCAYVALSLVRSFSQLYFLTLPLASHFIPPT